MGKSWRGPDRDKFDRDKYKKDRKNRQNKRSIDGEPRDEEDNKFNHKKDKDRYDY